MSRILVTGANGQLAKNLLEISENYPNFNFVFKNTKELDIVDASSVNELFSSLDFDYCINCAAYTDVEAAEQDSDGAFAVNAEGARNLATACAEKRVILVHISTDYVFDGTKETPYTTKDLPNPINIYGKSKLKGEVYIQEILKKFFIVRTSWLYSDHGKNFYRTILEKAKRGEPLTITDEQTGCPTNAKNLAHYILRLIHTKSNAYGIHHFTDGEAMTWYGFAQKILRDNGLEKKVSLDKAKNYRTFAKRPKNSVLGYK